MIRYIHGTVIDQTQQGLVVLVSGIGYLIFTTSRVQALPHDTITLHTYLAVRETALDLYGFEHEAELRIFELLLSIPKIGPKSALQILNQADISLIQEAVSLQDPVHLTKLSGMGKKTAEKVVLALKDSFTDPLYNTPQPERTSTYHDAFDTLVTLGYDAGAVRTLLDSLSHETLTTSELVKRALREL